MLTMAKSPVHLKLERIIRLIIFKSYIKVVHEKGVVRTDCRLAPLNWIDPTFVCKGRGSGRCVTLLAESVLSWSRNLNTLLLAMVNTTVRK